MTDKIVKINYLINFLNTHTKAYDEGHPIISDREWDEKYFELVELENETNIIFPNSPTQNIIYENVNALKKVEHSHKMLSLEKTKEINDIINFIGDKSYVAMCKMDGLTCSLTYQNGELVSAETRGNGLIGEDILHNAKIISSIPKHIPIEDKIVIDGEIICTYHDFEMFASYYKNPRNFASGSIRLLDANECAKRKLTFVAWDIIEGLEDVELLSNRLNKLEYCGFTVVTYVTGENNIEDEINTLSNKANKLGYPIDGIVFKYNDVKYGKSLGFTSHHFKNAMAYKFYDETYATKLIDIEWTMGRTGVLTPVALFEAIDIDGSTVERASVHNLSIMYETFHGNPFKGQSIEVFKANMIIPQIYSAEDLLIKIDLPYIEIPKTCPICGAPTEQRTDINSTVLVCSNADCDGKLINKLDHFCGKKGLDIKGLSKATLEKLIDWGWVSSITDIFTLGKYRNDWIKKSGFGVKSVDNLLNAIETQRNCDLDKFIAALGIPLVGSTVAKALANEFKTWDNFINKIDNYDFTELDNFGPNMNYEINHFNYNEAIYIVNNFIQFNTITENVGNNLNGLTFVITGKVSHFKNRDEIKSIIESLGGKVVGSISKNTDYLINNDINSTSSKNLSAKKLGIPIITEENFIQAFGIQ